MFHFVWRLIRKNWALHLLIPVVVGFAVESLFAKSSGDLPAWGWNPLWMYWQNHGGSLLSAYVAFLLVTVHFALREAAVQVTDIGLLDDILPKAKSYFAVGTIPLDEWFHPATVMYFANTFKWRIKNPQFSELRVMLFLRESDLDATQATYLDARYAKCFGDIHRSLEISLAYLNRHEILGALAEMDATDRAALGWCKALVHRYPGLMKMRRVPARWFLRRPIRSLAFAVIELDAPTSAEPAAASHPTATSRVLSFTKRKNALIVEEVKEASQKQAHLILGEKIKALVLDSEGKITHKRNFNDFLSR